MPAGIDELAAMAGLVLAIPGVIDLMIKYGAFIESKHEKYKNAKGIWSELMAYGVQLTKGNLNKMLLSARALYTEAGADPKMKDDMEIDIRRLEASLKLMTLFLENVKPTSRWGKLKFAMADEAEAKRLRKDLKEQEKDLKLKMDVIEQYKKLVPPELLLENKKFTEYDGWGYMIDPVLSVSAGDYTEDPIGNPPYIEKTVLIEKADVNAEGTKGSLKEIAGLLHRQLSDQDDQETMPSGNFPKKGILPILGYRLTPAPQLIFQMPPGFELPANAHTRPTSLRTLIAADAGTVPDHPLDFRFRLAQELCEAALRVHVVHLVHKNIRPETIFLFKPAVPDAAHEAAGFGDVYLTNWRLLREASGYTAKKPGSDAWAERIYRHPDRQGLQIESRYNLGHDIYSLGVCLLEIGLWDSFVIRTTASKPDGDTTTMTVAPSASFVASSEQGGFTTEADMYTAGNVKTTLLRLARGQLPARMGLGYQRLVVACLTALDKPSGFGPEVDFTTSARNDQVLDFVAVVKSYFQDLFK